MAYNKKYAELGESVIDYVNEREDAIEQGFDALITGGTNSNGSWVKFPDGTMICTHSLDFTSSTGNRVESGESKELTWRYPTSDFISVPDVANSIRVNTSFVVVANCYTEHLKTATTTNQPVVVSHNGNREESANVRIPLIAIGRWK